MKKLFTIITIAGMFLLIISCNSNSTDSKFLGTWQGYSATEQGDELPTDLIKLYTATVSKIEDRENSFLFSLNGETYKFTKQDNNILICEKLTKTYLKYDETTNHLFFILGEMTIEFEKL